MDIDCISIGGGAWKVARNPFGNGFIMLADRGIPEAGHVHVTSRYVDSHVETDVFSRSLAAKLPVYQQEIDAFCKFMQSLSTDTVAESIGAIFCTDLLTRICDDAVKLQYEEDVAASKGLGCHPDEQLNAIAESAAVACNGAIDHPVPVESLCTAFSCG